MRGPRFKHRNSSLKLIRTKKYYASFGREIPALAGRTGLLGTKYGPAESGFVGLVRWHHAPPWQFWGPAWISRHSSVVLRHSGRWPPLDRWTTRLSTGFVLLTYYAPLTYFNGPDPVDHWTYCEGGAPRSFPSESASQPFSPLRDGGLRGPPFSPLRDGGLRGPPFSPLRDGGLKCPRRISPLHDGGTDPPLVGQCCFGLMGTLRPGARSGYWP